MLSGKNVVITGSLQGIGRATLDFFAGNGANIWACSLSKTDEFETHCNELSDKFGVWVKPIYFNLLNNDEIKAGVKLIMSDKQQVDGLVNIAGMAKDALFQMVSMETMKLVFDVNFFSQIYLSQFIVKLMLRYKNPASIVFVSSISALDGNEGQLAYSSSKAALIGAMRTMSKELGPKGIRVNCIAPGVIDTDMNKVVPEEVIQQKINTMDIKRLGKPDEVASTIGYLVSDLSSFVTGKVIRIDGGIG